MTSATMWSVETATIRDFEKTKSWGRGRQKEGAERARRCLRGSAIQSAEGASSFRRRKRDPALKGVSQCRGLTGAVVWPIMWPMKTATVRDLKHNLAKVTRWLSLGEEVTLTRRGKPFARMVPYEGGRKPFRKPDFEAGLREIWGDAPPLTEEQTKRFWEELRSDR